MTKSELLQAATLDCDGCYRGIADAARDKALRAVAAWLCSVDGSDVVSDFLASAPDDWSSDDLAAAIAAELERIVGSAK